LSPLFFFLTCTPSKRNCFMSMHIWVF
jgi:hypothetical protein